MEGFVAKQVHDYQTGKISRRRLIESLTCTRCGDVPENGFEVTQTGERSAETIAHCLRQLDLHMEHRPVGHGPDPPSRLIETSILHGQCH